LSGFFLISDFIEGVLKKRDLKALAASPDIS
jgi:hypothetical protein